MNGGFSYASGVWVSPDTNFKVFIDASGYYTIQFDNSNEIDELFYKYNKGDEYEFKFVLGE